jgi:biopolymer transport protein ExbD
VRKLSHQEVEIQVTPMLDMAFQLLTFFILTYRQMPVEGQFAMSLLPASPVMDMNTPVVDAPPPAGQVELPAPLRTLNTTLRASDEGGLGSIQIGDNPAMTDLEALRAQVKTIFGSNDLPFEQVLIEVDPRLRYSDLMRVIDVFATENVTKISFATLEDRGM